MQVQGLKGVGIFQCIVMLDMRIVKVEVKLFMMELDKYK